MYNENKTKCVIVLAAIFFSIIGTSTVYADKSDRDHAYDYEDSYNDNSDYNYDDDRNTDYNYKDRSDQDYDSDINLDDIKQNNKEGDNYIIVENKQESTTEKIINFADRILGVGDRGYDEYNNREDEFGGGSGTNFDLVVLIGFNTHYSKKNIPEIKITAGELKDILTIDDLVKEKDENGKYYSMYETSFSFERLYQDSIEVCITPVNAPDEFSNCKDVEVKNGNQKTVRFFVS